jgi:HlyD family secretion protein
MSATVDIITDVRDSVIKVPIQCVTARQPLKPKPEKKTPAKAKGDGKKEGTKAGTETAAKPEAASGAKAPSAGDGKPVKCVFVVKDKIARQVAVETGISSDTEIEILKGLSNGDEVVSGSYRILSKLIKDGDKVTVNNSAKNQPEQENQKK